MATLLLMKQTGGTDLLSVEEHHRIPFQTEEPKEGQERGRKDDEHHKPNNHFGSGGRLMGDDERLSVRKKQFDLQDQQQIVTVPPIATLVPRRGNSAVHPSLSPSPTQHHKKEEEEEEEERRICPWPATVASINPASSAKRHNPAPNPLGQNISVVPEVSVASDPNLLKNTDSMWECLSPLIRSSPDGASTSSSRKRGRELPSREKDERSLETPRGDPPVRNQRRQQKKQKDHEEDGDQEEDSPEIGLTDHQAALWEKRFKELVSFHQRFSHCLVPHKWPENFALATWVKRQRYQWKLREQGKRSTLTTERRDALSDLGFVWDSHNAIWEERFNELVEFKNQYGHARVPSTYTNHSLSVWVQCQRRQWKLMKEEETNDGAPAVAGSGNMSSTSSRSNGAASSRMKRERVERLEALGFIWEPRGRKQQERATTTPGASSEILE